MVEAMKKSNRIIQSSLFALLLLIQSNVAQSHTDYAAQLGGASLSPPRETEATAGFTALFPGQATCSTGDPLEFNIQVSGLVGEITHFTLRLGGPEGELYARISPTDRSFDFDAETCDLLYKAEQDQEGVMGIPTPLFLTIETDLFPAGEIGGQLFMLISLPVLDTSWGQVKRVYR
jgi:hypothetical protein